MTHISGKVVITFGQGIPSLRLKPSDARKMADSIRKHAGKADPCSDPLGDLLNAVRAG